MLANIIGEIMQIGVGPMEGGFLDALTRTALVARLPELMSDEFVAEVVAISSSEDEIRTGELDARDCLTYARVNGKCEIFLRHVISAVVGNFAYGTISFVWTVCAAALIGAAN